MLRGVIERLSIATPGGTENAGVSVVLSPMPLPLPRPFGTARCRGRGRLTRIDQGSTAAPAAATTLAHVGGPAANAARKAGCSPTRVLESEEERNGYRSLPADHHARCGR